MIESADDAVLVILCALAVYYISGQLLLLSIANVNGLKKALQIQMGAVLFCAAWIGLYRVFHIFGIDLPFNIIIRDIGWAWMVYGAWRFRHCLKQGCMQAQENNSQQGEK